MIRVRWIALLFFLFGGLFPATARTKAAQAARSFETKTRQLAFVLLNAETGRIVDYYNKSLAMEQRYPPGSLAKVWNGAVLLESGFSPETFQLCKGSFRFPESIYSGSSRNNHHRSYSCWREGGHESLNLRTAIVHSCNVYFLEAATSFGVEKLYTKTVDRFRLHEAVRPPDMPGLLEVSGSPLPDPDQVEMLLASIGEGGAILLSPLKIASIFAEIYTGNSFASNRLPGRGTISFRTRSILLGSLSRVIEEGTLQRINFRTAPGVVLEGGKTGGATIAGRKFETHGWNVLLLRIQGKPHVLVSFVTPGSGSDEAAILSRRILETLP